MKHITIFALLIANVLVSNLAFSQRSCSSAEHHHHMLQHDADYNQKRNEIELHTQQYLLSAPSKSRSTKIIPVVFHILIQQQYSKYKRCTNSFAISCFECRF